MSDAILELKVERLELAKLRPHPKNPRKHPKKGSPRWEMLKRSLQHDYFDPLVWNSRNGLLVSGHFRRSIMEEMKITAADVVVVDYDESTHLARMIAANRQAGEFEEELLAAISKDLDLAGIDSALAGFDEKEFASLLEGPEPVDDTEETEQLVTKADELQVQWQVKPGDLWQIGNHRLFCGDCTSGESWQQLLGDTLADLVWTDPPYNVNYEDLQERRNELAKKRGKAGNSVAQGILNDDLSEEDYEGLLQRAFAIAFKVAKPGAAIYVAHADHFGLINRSAMIAGGWYVAQCLIWVKNAFTLGRQDYQWQHEPILYGWKPGAGHYWQGGFGQATVIDEELKLTKLDKRELIALIEQMRNDRDTTVIRAPRNTSAALHPTIKPIGLVSRQIWNSSRRGETVVELFGGSGTTLAASEQTGRRCVATELDPKYCAVILERMSAYGLKIEKIDGRS